MSFRKVANEVSCSVKRCIFLLFLIFIPVSGLLAQSKRELDRTIKSIMENIRNNRFEQVQSDILYDEKNAVQVLNLLKPYYEDSLYNIRSKAYSLAGVVGRNSKDRGVRIQATDILSAGCSDKEAGVIGVCSEALQLYKLADFSDVTKDRIRLLLIPSVPYLNKLVQLTGFLGDTKDISLLQSLLVNQKLSAKDKWAVQLALARLGDMEMLNQVVARIKRLPVNDDVIYQAAPAMVYIRQQQSIDYLFEIIMSENNNCLSANPNSDENILCAYRVLEFVAPIIQNFPLKVDAGGDLDVDNYPAALSTARDWYQAHKDNYELIKDTF
jgi:hypothetical protein